MKKITLNVGYGGSTFVQIDDGEWQNAAVLDEPLRTQVSVAAQALVATGYWDWHMPDGSRERFLPLGPRLATFA